MRKVNPNGTNKLLMQYNWYWFAEGYINATEILLDKISQTEGIPTIKTNDLWLPPSTIAHIAIPIFYNIRHIFELVIKTTEAFKNKEISFTHDKKKLVASLSEIYGNEHDISKNFIDIVEKYYNPEFYNTNFNQKGITDDPLNEFFRFPVDKRGVNHVDPSLFTRIHKRIVWDIAEDVKELHRILRRFHSETQKWKYNF